MVTIGDHFSESKVFVYTIQQQYTCYLFFHFIRETSHDSKTTVYMTCTSINVLEFIIMLSVLLLYCSIRILANRILYRFSMTSYKPENPDVPPPSPPFSPLHPLNPSPLLPSLSSTKLSKVGRWLNFTHIIMCLVFQKNELLSSQLWFNNNESKYEQTISDIFLSFF